MKKKPVSIQDLYRYRFLGGMSASEDGSYAAFTIAQMNEKKNNYGKKIRLVRMSDHKILPITKSENYTGYTWEDDHTLLLTEKNRSEKEETTFVRYNPDTKTVKPAFKIGMNVMEIHKLDNDTYLFRSAVNTNYDRKEDEKENSDYIPVTELPFWFNAVGYVSGWRDALFLYHVKKKKAVKLTEKEFYLGNICVSPDKKTVYYTGHAYTQMALGKKGLYSYDVESGETKEIIKPNTWRIGQLIYLGEKLVVTASKQDKHGTNDKDDFYTLSRGKLKLLAENDFTIGCNVSTDVRYLKGGKPIKAYGNKLAYLSTERYSTVLKTLDDKGNTETILRVNGVIESFAVSKEEIVFTAMSDMRLQEVYVFDGTSIKKISDFNTKELEDKYVGIPEHFEFEDRDGVMIDGWYIKPINFNEKKKYPAALTIHGGPCIAWGELFVHEMQALAGQGYIVVYCNPRGGDGKGAAFADIRGRWGEPDFNDFMDFCDEVEKRVPQIDHDHFGVLGGSYGGYMTNWILGNTTRFAAAASQRSISNALSDFGTSCLGFNFDVEQFGGVPWVDTEKLWKQSPLKYAGNVVTPTLFIHSLEDYNCALEQGLEMFSALKYRGVPSKMMLFKGENHELSRTGKPSHRQKRLKEIFDWFELYLK